MAVKPLMLILLYVWTRENGKVSILKERTETAKTTNYDIKLRGTHEDFLF